MNQCVPSRKLNSPASALANVNALLENDGAGLNRNVRSPAVASISTRGVLTENLSQSNQLARTRPIAFDCCRRAICSRVVMAANDKIGEEMFALSLGGMLLTTYLTGRCKIRYNPVQSDVLT